MRFLRVDSDAAPHGASGRTDRAVSNGLRTDPLQVLVPAWRRPLRSRDASRPQLLADQSAH
jgi:hypothetical protein